MENSAELNSGVIRAAGALLWRKSAHGDQVLVIYRDRYKDWTLPKGKLNEGENWEQAALREINEETGYDGQITGFAGAISYPVNKQEKVVLFWHMAAGEQTIHEMDTEVASTEWLTVEQALARLQYPLERALLEVWKAGPVATEVPETLNFAIPKDSFIHKRFLWGQHKYARERLKEELVVFLAEYSTVRKRYDLPERIKEIDSLIQRCLSALNRNEMRVAWQAYKAAHRTYLYLLEHNKERRNEVQARAVAIRNEAQAKLKESSWRYATIKDYLPDPPDGDPVPNYPVDKVVLAANLMDGYHDNIYRRLSNISSNLNHLTYLIVLAIGVWLALAPTQIEINQFFSIRPLKIPALFWASIFLFGFMGSIFSGYLFSRRQNLHTEIPIQLLGFSLTIARMGVGCLSALIVTIFLFARFLNFGEIYYETVLALAFVAGFSEQFVLRMVQAVAERE